MIFIFDCLRVARLTGDCPKGEALTVAKVMGQEKKTPALVHILFKKQDLVEFMLHEAELLDKDLPNKVRIFRSPWSLMKHFSAIGETGLVASFRSASGETSSGETFETLFALQVAQMRNEFSSKDAKVQVLIDLLWAVWSGVVDEEIMELCVEDMGRAAGQSGTFLWHRHLSESPKELGAMYRSFLATSTGGPISADSAASGTMLAGLGSSELAETDQEDLKKVQDLIMNLRRKSVNFVVLPAVGAASGADYSTAQLQKIWETMRLGHNFARKKADVRAWIFSADLFPPEPRETWCCGGHFGARPRRYRSHEACDRFYLNEALEGGHCALV